MCRTCTMSRRAFLGAGASLTLAGCDDPPALVSDETVEAMGLQAWAEISTSTPRSRDRELQAALDRVSARLVQAAGGNPAEWEAVVFARPDINAFALPGRKIGVYEGMFRVANTEDMLATIVGHEIGHIQAEHGQKRMSAQVARNAGIRLLAFFLDMGDVQYAEEIAAALGLGVEVGLLLPYSRGQEEEADVLGLHAMAEAGYDPQAALTLWRRMDQAVRDRPPDFLATHPAPSARIETLAEIIRTLPAR